MTARIAVIGGGSQIFAAAHAPALAAADIEVTGTFDIDRTRAAEIAEPYGWPVFGDRESLLATHPQWTVICTPHPLHADAAIAALRAGSDVLLEKPLAPRLAEIDEVLAVAREAGRTVVTLHQHRLRAEVREAAQLIADRALGTIHRALLEGSYPKRSNYFSDRPWRGTWRGERGGTLLNQGLHDVDLLQHLLGEPQRVYGVLRTRVHPIEAEDTADALWEWADGRTASLHVTSAAGLESNRIDVFGSAADLRIDAAGLHVRAHDEDFLAFARTEGGHLDPYPRGEWTLRTPRSGGDHAAAYADALGGGELLPRGAQARTAVELIAATVSSSLRGAAIALPLSASDQDAALDALAERSTR